MSHRLSRWDIFSHIERRIHKVYVLLIQLLPQQLHRLTEALEVDHFPFPKESDHIIHIRIIRKPQNIIIGNSGLLLWHSGLKTTNIHRKLGNKRLILTKNEHFLLYVLL